MRYYHLVASALCLLLMLVAILPATAFSTPLRATPATLHQSSSLMKITVRVQGRVILFSVTVRTTPSSELSSLNNAYVYKYGKSVDLKRSSFPE